MGSFPRFTSTYHSVATQMRLPLAFVGGKPSNPALVTAYDTVILSVNHYIITQVSSVLFFLLFTSSPSIFLLTYIQRPRSLSRPPPLPIVFKRPSGCSTALLRTALLPTRVRTYSVLRPAVLTWPNLRLRPAGRTRVHRNDRSSRISRSLLPASNT